MSEQKRDDGGAAFPCEQGHVQEHGWNQTFESGMSLRDYFAAKAMQGFASSDNETIPSVTVIAGWSYEMADAMLEARKK